MPRIQQTSNEKILEAALEMFLRDGLKASTVEIARRAGVSEATLFKRFVTKETLFEAALMVEEQNQSWPQQLLTSVGQNTPLENLERALREMAAKLERIIPRMYLLRSRGAKHWAKSPPKDIPPIQDEQTLCDYLEAEIKLGRIQMESPRIHAHQIVGEVVHYIGLKETAGYIPCGSDDYFRAVARLHLP